MKRKPKRYRMIGRSAYTGQFVPLAIARKYKRTHIVQRIGFR